MQIKIFRAVTGVSLPWISSCTDHSILYTAKGSDKPSVKVIMYSVIAPKGQRIDWKDRYKILNGPNTYLSPTASFVSPSSAKNTQRLFRLFVAVGRGGPGFRTNTSSCWLRQWRVFAEFSLDSSMPTPCKAAVIEAEAPSRVRPFWAVCWRPQEHLLLQNH